MKLFAFLVVLAVTTTLDAAIIKDAGGIDTEKLLKTMDPTVLHNAGRAMQTLGRVLQGDVSVATAEERNSLVGAVKALSLIDEVADETDEHGIIGTIVKNVATGAGAALVEAAAKEVIEFVKSKIDG